MCGIGQMFDTHLSRTQIGHHIEGLRKNVCLLISPKEARGVLVEGGKTAHTKARRAFTPDLPFLGVRLGGGSIRVRLGAHSKKRAMM